MLMHTIMKIRLSSLTFLIFCTICVGAFTTLQSFNSNLIPLRLPTATFSLKTRKWNGQKFMSSPFTASSLLVSDSSIGDNSQVDNGSSSITPLIGLPSYRQMILFIATTVLIWISEPLLSLVDSAAVGRYVGIHAPQNGMNLLSVVQLAALGPATMLCDSLIYATYAIAMATTNKLATSFAKNELNEQIYTVSNAMMASLMMGAFLLLIINLRGESLLSSILGPTGATITTETAKGVVETIELMPQVLHAALGYARIRSAVYPLSVMGMTAQAVLLCAGDIQTPILAVIVASLINIIGDYFFVAKMGFGVRGAALATSISSVMANGILVNRVRKMQNKWKKSLPVKRDITRQLRSDHVEKETVVDLAKMKFVSISDRKSFMSLLQLAGPLFIVLIGKVIGYSVMTIRAGSFGMVSLACHNVLMRIFFFFGTIGDGISHCAQSFMPGLLYKESMNKGGVTHKDGFNYAPKVYKSTDESARTLLKRLIFLSLGAGTTNYLIGRFIAKNAGRAFTTDASLVSLMSHVSPLMGVALFIHPFALTLEGSIIAGENINHVVGTYVSSTVVLLCHLHFACHEFIGVWYALLLFQLLRIIQFGTLIFRKTRKGT